MSRTYVSAKARETNLAAFQSTPDEAHNGRPLTVWEGLMGRERSHVPGCLHCAGEWCERCSADPLSPLVRQMLAMQEPVVSRV